MFFLRAPSLSTNNSGCDPGAFPPYRRQLSPLPYWRPTLSSEPQELALHHASDLNANGLDASSGIVMAQL